MTRLRAFILAPLVGLLVSCDGDPAPRTEASPTGGATPPRNVCTLIEAEVIPAVANAESRAAARGDLVAALNRAEGLLQEEGIPLLDREQDEPLGRVLLELSGEVAKVRLAVIEAHQPSVEAAADGARAVLELEPLRERCGTFSTGET